MKRTFLKSALIAILFLTGQAFGYEIHFMYPTNGATLDCYLNNTAPIDVNYDFSGRKDHCSYYAKLFTQSGTYSNHSQHFPWLYPGLGTYSWRIELIEINSACQEYKVAEQTITFTVKYSLSAQNNFGSGIINLDNATVASHTDTYKFVNESVALGAIDQSDGTYNRIWNTNGTNNSNWIRQPSVGNYTYINGATSRNYSYTVQNNDSRTILIADLKKLYNVTFQNSGHQISINGSNYSSSGTVQIVEGNPTYASTDNYTSNGLNYWFSGWTNDGGATYSNPVTPINNSTYTAYYTVTPNASYSSQNLHVGTTLNDNIHIYWTDNPNSVVDQYLIYRKIGYRGTPVLLTTVGRGVQQCTDGCYYLQQYPNGTEVLYEVLEYSSYYNSYSYDNTWADTYGYYSNQQLKNNNVSLGIAKEIPTEYKMENYPNPFNPTTLINYQLPQDGYVTIKVYDILGKEIATLVNENKTAGYYKVNFDASRLTSGVYIYRISSNNFSLSKKMLLTK